MHDLLNALFIANNVGDAIGWSRPALTDSGLPETSENLPTVHMVVPIGPHCVLSV